MVHALQYLDDSVSIPAGVVDIHSFRRWASSDDFPDIGRFWWLGGYVWLDITVEEIFSHVGVKTEYTVVLGGLAKAKRSGTYLTDGVLLSNFAADISGEPDGMYLSNETLDSDRVRFIEGRRGGFTELQGSPDMALEIVSVGSVRKDTQVMKQKYWEADVREYWLVDARRTPAKFTIYRHTARGYVAVRPQDGWLKSTVFGRSFRLTQGLNARLQPVFTLEHH